MEPGGLWDSGRFEVKALITKDDKPAGEAALQYAGKTSQFEGRLTLAEAGVYQVTVFAFDPTNGNTGVDATTIIVTP